jgi:hypothetical protein
LTGELTALQRADSKFTGRSFPSHTVRARETPFAGATQQLTLSKDCEGLRIIVENLGQRRWSAQQLKSDQLR